MFDAVALRETKDDLHIWEISCIFAERFGIIRN